MGGVLFLLGCVVKSQFLVDFISLLLVEFSWIHVSYSCISAKPILILYSFEMKQGIYCAEFLVKSKRTASITTKYELTCSYLYSAILLLHPILKSNDSFFFLLCMCVKDHQTCLTYPQLSASPKQKLYFIINGNQSNHPLWNTALMVSDTSSWTILGWVIYNW